jgi:hypothetical protein
VEPSCCYCNFCPVMFWHWKELCCNVFIRLHGAVMQSVVLRLTATVFFLHNKKKYVSPFNCLFVLDCTSTSKHCRCFCHFHQVSPLWEVSFSIRGDPTEATDCQCAGLGRHGFALDLLLRPGSQESWCAPVGTARLD